VSVFQRIQRTRESIAQSWFWAGAEAERAPTRSSRATDAVFGLLTAALATGVAILLARLNPDWSFGGFPRRTPSRDVEPQPEPEAAPA